MELLPNADCGARRPFKEAIHIGSGGPVKGLLARPSPEVETRPTCSSRDFAVVAAQKAAPVALRFSILLAVSVKLFH
jgi:hypothetical protein